MTPLETTDRAADQAMRLLVGAAAPARRPVLTSTAYYKRLVLDLCHACSEGRVAALDKILTPDFVDAGFPSLRHGFTDPDMEILGLVGEGNTVVLRVRLSGIEQVQFFEGRDERLAARYCIPMTLS